jgi:hypothetical protein
MRPSAAATSGTRYYAGGQEILSAADAKVSQGAVLLMALSWKCEEYCTLQSDLFFVANGQQGRSTTKASFFFNNHSWVSSSESASLTGRFEFKGDDTSQLYLTGAGTAGAIPAVVTAQLSENKMFEVASLQQNGVWINSYVNLHHLSSLSYTSSGITTLESTTKATVPTSLFGILPHAE